MNPERAASESREVNKPSYKTRVILATLLTAGIGIGVLGIACGNPDAEGQNVTKTPSVVQTVELSQTAAVSETVVIDKTPTPENPPYHGEVNRENYLNFLSKDPNVKFREVVVGLNQPHLREVNSLARHAINLVKEENNTEVEISNSRDLLKAVYPIESNEELEAVIFAVNDLVMTKSEVDLVVNTYKDQIPDLKRPQEPRFDANYGYLTVWETPRFGCFEVDKVTGKFIHKLAEIKVNTYQIFQPSFPPVPSFRPDIEDPIVRVDGPNPVGADLQIAKTPSVDNVNCID